jgi:hypothetical protein
MANKTYVSVKSDVKDVFDKGLKPDLITAMTRTIETAINANGKLTTKDKAAKGFSVIATLVSLMPDDKDKPTSLEAKVSIGVTSFGGTLAGFNASGSATATGINPKKMAEEARLLTRDVVDDAMEKRVIPQLLKMIP